MNNPQEFKETTSKTAKKLGYIKAKSNKELIKEIIGEITLNDIRLKDAGINIDEKLIEDLREKEIFTIKDLFKKEKLNDLI